MGNNPSSIVDPDGGCDTGDCPDPTLVNGDANLAAEANRLSELNAGRPNSWVALLEDFSAYGNSGGNSGEIGFLFSGTGGFQDGLLRKNYSAQHVYTIDIKNDLYIFGIGNGYPGGGGKFKGDGRTPESTKSFNQEVIDRLKNSLTAKDKASDAQEAHDRITKRERALFIQDSLKKVHKDNGAFRIYIQGTDSSGIKFFDKNSKPYYFKLNK